MKNSNYKNSFWKKGSLTVESSLLVPMVIFLCVLLILYCFYEHNRVWYTAAAYETALVGTRKNEIGINRETAALMRAQERLDAQPFPGTVPHYRVEVEQKKASVQYRADDKKGFIRSFPYEVQGSVKQVNPVSWIRTAWIAKILMNSK